MFEGVSVVFTIVDKAVDGIHLTIADLSLNTPRTADV